MQSGPAAGLPATFLLILSFLLGFFISQEEYSSQEHTALCWAVRNLVQVSGLRHTTHTVLVKRSRMRKG